MDKLVICALAKNENAYINDWVKYHLDHGYDRIYLYDNNDKSDPYVGDCIDAAYRDKVVVVDVRGENLRSKQAFVYNRFITKHCNDYEWCTFIDVDEFVVADDMRGLVDGLPNDFDCLALNWQVYGDDGVIVGDESIPVYERITNKLYDGDNPFNRIVKTTVRGGAARTFFVNSHVCTRNGHERKYCDCDGKRVSLVNNHKTIFGNHRCYIAHYMTKTLSEFLKYKIRRLSTMRCNRDDLKTDYFFRMNEKTPEKLQFITKWNETVKELNPCAIK